MNWLRNKSWLAAALLFTVNCADIADTSGNELIIPITILEEDENDPLVSDMEIGMLCAYDHNKGPEGTFAFKNMAELTVFWEATGYDESYKMQEMAHEPDFGQWSYFAFSGPAEWSGIRVFEGADTVTVSYTVSSLPTCGCMVFAPLPGVVQVYFIPFTAKPVVFAKTVEPMVCEICGRGYYWVDADALPRGTGRVLREPDLEEYAAGSEVRVTAIPNACYTFDRWYGLDGDNHDSSITITVNRLFNLGAFFRRQEPCDPISEPGTFIDTRDGKKYRKVTIGTQVWMAENLNYQGNEHLNYLPSTYLGQCYNGNPGNCDTYGRLYYWHEVMALSPVCEYENCSDQIWEQHQGICPPGWYVPTANEWQTLMDYAGESSGRKLKATHGWHTDEIDQNSNGTDDFGFAALPGGMSFGAGRFSYSATLVGYWWSATEHSDTTAHYRTIWYNNYVVERNGGKNYNISLRCVSKKESASIRQNERQLPR